MQSIPMISTEKELNNSMPFFKTTYNIVVDSGEHFESKWMDSNELQLPPKQDWDYSRELNIDDVDLWEVIYEDSATFGLYAAWLPYAEFYLMRFGWNERQGESPKLETFYGKGALQRVVNRAKSFGVDLAMHKHWVDNDKMWLYS